MVSPSRASARGFTHRHADAIRSASERGIAQRMALRYGDYGPVHIRDTVGGSEIRRENHLGSQNPVNTGINYQPELVSRISEPSTVAPLVKFEKNHGSIYNVPPRFSLYLQYIYIYNID